MATIQIREVAEESYELLRRRACRAGQPTHAYMREEIVKLAARPTKGEAVASIGATLRVVGGPSPTAKALLGDLAAGRR